MQAGQRFAGTATAAARFSAATIASVAQSASEKLGAATLVLCNSETF
jgi:hypothetical protein